MFAVWLMFGILGIPIQKELGLSDEQLSWISALAVLNGSMWRLPAGILADRIGGRKVTLFLLFASAIPAYPRLVRRQLRDAARARFPGRLRGQPVLRRHRLELLPGTARSVRTRARRVRRGQRRRLRHEVHRPAADRRNRAGSTYFLGIQGGWRLIPVIYAVLLVIVGILTWVIVPRQDPARPARPSRSRRCCSR